MAEPYNSGDEAQVKHRKSKATIAEEQRIADMRFVMSTPAGRRFVWRQVGSMNVFSDVTGSDPFIVGRFLGGRAHGLRLYSEVIKHCPNEYLLMQAEAMKADKETVDG